MKKMTAFIFGVFICLVAGAQNPPAVAGQVVQWEYNSKKTGVGEYEVTLTAVIQTGWHLYSQFTPDGGPVPTQISFNKNPLVLFNGTIKEIGALQEKHEEVFDVKVKYYNNKVVFKQAVILKKNVKTKVSGVVEYMVCDDTQCLPPRKVSFAIDVK